MDLLEASVDICRVANDVTLRLRDCSYELGHEPRDGKIVRVDEGYPQTGRALLVMRADWTQALMKKFGPEFEKAIKSYVTRGA